MKKKQTFEEALETAGGIVTELEKGDLSLEEAMKKYKDGSELLAYCQAALTDAELEFSKIVETINSNMEKSEE